MKRSLTFVGVLGSPRNKDEYLLAAGPDLDFSSTLESFILLPLSVELFLNSHIPG